MSKIAVLIPTRNRPEKIAKLLDSLRSSTIKPNQIIVVASGADIKNHLKPFEDIFEITYQYTQIVGQIAQKRIGISLINEENNWCLFLDDDLTVDRRAIEFALEAVNSRFAPGVVGVGLSLPSTSRAQNASRITVRMGSLFGIHTNIPGKVLRNGHATSYLHLGEIVTTEWLNGASMWRKSVVDTYGLGIPSTRYAACEDLIFSYPLRKKGELIYAPKAKLHFQDVELSDFDSQFVFESASYWRYYFVCQNGLSRISFFYSQFGRIIYIVLKTRNKKLSTFSKFIQTQTPLLKSYFGRKPHLLLLEELVGK
jgi:GT2 family glycosyltransferase